MAWRSCTRRFRASCCSPGRYRSSRVQARTITLLRITPNIATPPLHLANPCKPRGLGQARYPDPRPAKSLSAQLRAVPAEILVIIDNRIIGPLANGFAELPPSRPPQGEHFINQ